MTAKNWDMAASDWGDEEAKKIAKRWGAKIRLEKELITTDLFREDIAKGKWVIESNATMTGANLEWAVNLLCERAEKPENIIL